MLSSIPSETRESLLLVNIRISMKSPLQTPPRNVKCSAKTTLARYNELVIQLFSPFSALQIHYLKLLHDANPA